MLTGFCFFASSTMPALSEISVLPTHGFWPSMNVIWGAGARIGAALYESGAKDSDSIGSEVGRER